ncbi:MULTISPECIES: hypothetical protein [unclassified Caulobacter]|nr:MULTISPECIES: hypothetical protein [unclassified Caulobacter]
MAIRLILICTLLSLAALSVLADGRRPTSHTARSPAVVAG